VSQANPYVFSVPFRDVGMRGEMHSSAYLAYAEEALGQFWAARAPQASDPAFCVSKVSCQLHKALHFGDEVKTSVRASKIGGKTAGFAVLMYRGEDLVAEAEIVWSACDADSGEPVPLPEELRDWLYQYLE
jgi:acyl-CoA thioester hydrolase